MDAKRFDKAKLPITLVLVTGKNTKLRAKLEARRWSTPVKIFGFMHTFTAA